MGLEPLHPIQIRRFREMTPAEKWQVALGLLRTARQTRAVAIRTRHPSWTNEEVERAVAQEIARART
ncbi:MAG TPA: hypothetical protein PLU30_19360 [Verrucomicrobiae bacterium]|nr:hypothetical protein [Verrucomicrobiae bacterium]